MNYPYNRHDSLALGRALASAVWVVTLACSSEDFQSCEKTKTCENEASDSGGSDGTASGDEGAGAGSVGGGERRPGEAGAAGAENEGAASGSNADRDAEAGQSDGSGGTGAPPRSCTTSSECDDGLACNGHEICEDGSCTAGEAVECDNPDLEHCTSRCVETGADYECLIEARDADDDGHPSASCEASPGDDCDDGDGGVHPGAQEVCDGIDNDCNGAEDLEDGLALAGNINVLSDVAAVDVGWSPALNRFGVAYVAPLTTENPPRRSLFLGTIAAGVDYEEVGHVADADGAPGSFLGVSWGDEHWTLWENSGPLGTNSIQAHHVDAAGNRLRQTEGGITEGRDVAYREAGDWLVVANAGSPLRLLSLASDDSEAELVERDTLDATLLFPRIATLGNTGAVVWQRANPSGIEWTLVSESLGFGEPEELSAEGQRPRIAAFQEGYAITWATETGFSYETRTVDGDVLCGPVPIAFGNGVLDDTDTAALAATDLGVVVVALDRADGALELFRFDGDCELSGRAIVSETRQELLSVNVASGAAQVAVSWTAKSNTGVSGHVRSFGWLLCD